MAASVMEETDNLGVALNLARQHIPVFPCNQEKRPLIGNGFKGATCDIEQIQRWWEMWPDALVGMPTGKASGIVVLDCDIRKEYDGTKTLAKLRAEHGAWVETRRGFTPNGIHYYFRITYPVLRNSAGKLGPGLDSRGEGGYVIAAGSRMLDGGRYELDPDSPQELAEMPAWMLRKLGEEPRPSEAPHKATEAPGAGQGQRNDYLASYAGRLAHAGLHVEQVRSAVYAENQRACFPPLPEAELERTILKSTATRWVRTGETVSDLEELPPPPSVDEYLALNIPKQAQILGPITTQQLVMVHAPTGTGKTMWSLALCFALSHNRGLHGWEPGEGLRSVLYVDGEMSGAMMQDRLKGAQAPDLYLANIQHWAMVNGYPPVNIAKEDGQAIIERWIQATGATVVALDNFMSLAHVPGHSLSSDEFWNPVKAWMMRLRGRGLTVIVVDHSNEGGTLHGTKTRTWQMDLNIVLRPIEDQSEQRGFVQRIKRNRVTLQFQKARAGDGSAVFEARELTLGNPWEDWQWRPATAGIQERALEMVAAGMPYMDIVQTTGISKTALYRLAPRKKGGK